MLGLLKPGWGRFMEIFNKVRFILVVLLIIAAFVFRMKHENDENYFVERRLLMDTIITISAWPEESRPAVDKAFAEFANIEKWASFHLTGSELTKLNSTLSLPASASISELLKLSGEYVQKTQGYFDPSFALLQKAYGFYSGKGRIPDDAELTGLLAANCGFAKVLKLEGNNWALASGSLLDLGGIAGGYAIVKARNHLRAASCTAFLIDDAGDIWFEGRKSDGKPWRIAVRDPRDNTALAYVESYQPLAVSTSGDYERFITVNDKRYGHIMNPHTGRPVDYYSSLTLIASDPIAADALSTAVFAMPPEIAFNYVEQNNLAALFLTSSGTIHLSTLGKALFTKIKPQ